MDLSLDDEQLAKVVQKVAKTDDGLLLIGHFISEANIFRRGLADNADKENYLRGVAAHGAWINEVLETYAPDEYLKLMKIGVEKIKKEQSNGRK